MFDLRTRLQSALDGYRIERQVAIKVMRPDLGASDGPKRFVREMWNADRLRSVRDSMDEHAWLAGYAFDD